MRLWSLHPEYLDGVGLVALWREGLLARKVLKGETTGYRRHPQLERFKAQPDPVKAIDFYLRFVYEEAARRGYRFDRGKIGACLFSLPVPVTEGQLAYELMHLKEKLNIRDRGACRKLSMVAKPDANPLFTVVPGGVEPWEKVRTGLPGNP